MTKRKLALLLAVTAVVVTAIRKPDLADLLPSTATAGKQANDAFLVASAQLVRPWSQTAEIKGRPADLAIDPTGSFAAILNGTSVVTIELATGREISRVTTKTTSYLGIRFRPNTNEIWASEATRTGPDALLKILYTASGVLGKLERMELKGHPIPAGLAFTKDGGKLYAALHHTNEVITVDPANLTITARWPSELAPFSLTLSNNGETLYVSNRGGAPRAEAKQARSGNVPLPVDDQGSVLPGTVQVFNTVTGVAKSIPAGLAPAGVALSPDGLTLAVANSHGDTVTIIDTKTGNTATLEIDTANRLPGILPNSLAFRADGLRLYVACGGENSVAVFARNKGKWQLAGKLPTGWFPTAVQLDAKGTIHIASVKGLGDDEQEAGRHNSRVYEGILSSIPDPAPAQLHAGAREVQLAARPRFTPNGGVKDLAKLGIQHVFFRLLAVLCG